MTSYRTYNRKSRNKYIVGRGFVDFIRSIPLAISGIFSRLPSGIQEGIQKTLVPALTTAGVAGLSTLASTGISKVVSVLKKKIEGNLEKFPPEIANKLDEKSKQFMESVKSNPQKNMIVPQSVDSENINSRISGMGLKTKRGRKKLGNGIKTC